MMKDPEAKTSETKEVAEWGCDDLGNLHKITDKNANKRKCICCGCNCPCECDCCEFVCCTDKEKLKKLIDKLKGQKDKDQ